MKTLVAIDGSDCSMRALNFIVSRPWKAEDQFLVVCIVEPVPQDFCPGPPIGVEQRFFDECAEIAGKGAAKLKTGLPKNQVEVKVDSGLVAEMICRTAREWQADLIVMGSHGRKGLSHFFLGSVAEEVLKTSPCSVEIVKTKLLAEEVKECAKKKASAKVSKNATCSNAG